ncbi:hypothetical protein [Chitinilyticum aquatile]|uniref:hypothetical protein n=1 Tax=Chitinilyticum aquatile TaxID=362520 RepID=UPI0004227584|nr:hypothetical protein [Chitinilyticum aquatile]
MASTYRLQLGVAMLSPGEAELALEAIRLSWSRPSRVHRQLSGDMIALLTVQHEDFLRVDESADWFIERIAASIWQALGRFACISIDIAPHEAPDGKLYILDEPSYRAVMQKFRFTPTLQR